MCNLTKYSEYSPKGNSREHRENPEVELVLSNEPVRRYIEWDDTYCPARNNPSTSRPYGWCDHGPCYYRNSTCPAKEEGIRRGNYLGIAIQPLGTARGHQLHRAHNKALNGIKDKAGKKSILQKTRWVDPQPEVIKQFLPATRPDSISLVFHFGIIFRGEYLKQIIDAFGADRYFDLCPIPSTRPGGIRYEAGRTIVSLAEFIQDEKEVPAGARIVVSRPPPVHKGHDVAVSDNFTITGSHWVPPRARGIGDAQRVHIPTDLPAGEEGTALSQRSYRDRKLREVEKGLLNSLHLLQESTTEAVRLLHHRGPPTWATALYAGLCSDYEGLRKNYGDTRLEDTFQCLEAVFERNKESLSKQLEREYKAAAREKGVPCHPEGPVPFYELLSQKRHCPANGAELAKWLLKRIQEDQILSGNIELDAYLSTSSNSGRERSSSRGRSSRSNSRSRSGRRRERSRSSRPRSKSQPSSRSSSAGKRKTRSRSTSRTSGSRSRQPIKQEPREEPPPPYHPGGPRHRAGATDQGERRERLGRKAKSGPSKPIYK